MKLHKPIFRSSNFEALLFQKNYSVIYIKEEENTTLANGSRLLRPTEELEIFECTE